MSKSDGRLQLPNSIQITVNCIYIYAGKEKNIQNKTKLQILGFQKKPKLTVSMFFFCFVFLVLFFALDMTGYIICECADVQVAGRLTSFETYGLM